MNEEAGTVKNAITDKLAADVQKYIELRLKFSKKVKHWTSATKDEYMKNKLYK